MHLSIHIHAHEYALITRIRPEHYRPLLADLNEKLLLDGTSLIKDVSFISISTPDTMAVVSEILLKYAVDRYEY